MGALGMIRGTQDPERWQRRKQSMLDKIKLNLINLSQDINNSEVLIFQKNVAESFGEIAVA
jgi:hypothetical protein